ncbi:M18 family aminopeptidase [Trueperella sp. LYQ143]|uniref:M18 family aminopeptidase n=1 Tax=unclassified Trueperella TaxID=2630174 RepID=UPI003982E8FC
MCNQVSEYLSFLSQSPTSFHAADVLTRQLANAGYTQQDECEAWAGHDRGYIQRGGSVIAWRISEVTDYTGFRIVGSHTDSPTFRLKPVSASAYGFSQVAVEVYGGPLLNSWLNRDLGIAGLLTEIDGTTHLVRTDPCMVIPQLAPHLDREQNSTLKLSAQRDYKPIWACGEHDIMEYICAQAEVDPQRVAAGDLFAYEASAPRQFGGPDGTDFVAGARQDNLSSVYAALRAFLGQSSSESSHDIQIFVAFDHEEVGSETFAGAAGPFLESVLRRLAVHLYPQDHGDERFVRMMALSSCISADAGHSINPNRPQKHDPEHQPVLGSGPMLKINASQRYATESQGSALWLRACYWAQIASQEFVSHNDVSCGSTIGHITATRLGITTVDVGVPLLSMHAARELSAFSDILDLSRALEGYWAGV